MQSPTKALVAVPLLALVSLTGCLLDSSPAPASTPTPTPTPARAVDPGLDEIANRVIDALARNDLPGFTRTVMLSREAMAEALERTNETCPELASSPEARARAESSLREYDPASDAVRDGFARCSARHDFTKARIASATAREHQSTCGVETADHVSVVVVISDDESATVVLDDLIRTPDGWRVMDAGISCD